MKYLKLGIKIGFGVIKRAVKALEDGELSYNEGIDILKFVAECLGVKLDKGFKVK